ncbi:MAG: hypothetical protein K2M07_05625 [Muribaculaceae bacterium]|nr:hypothetical protein [Muribaculaceae bacterium]
MSTRKDRIGLITSMIRNGRIVSQEQLQHLLEAEGVKVTQATLSRDLRMIGATRRCAPEGKSYYSMPEQVSNEYIEADFPLDLPVVVSGLRERFGEELLSVAISRNIVVLKTRPGYASGLAVEIDFIGSPYILGTVAGADTVLMVLHEGLSKEKIRQLLMTFIPSTIINSKENYPQVR